MNHLYLGQQHLQKNATALCVRIPMKNQETLLDATNSKLL